MNDGAVLITEVEGLYIGAERETCIHVHRHVRIRIKKWRLYPIGRIGWFTALK